MPAVCGRLRRGLLCTVIMVAGSAVVGVGSAAATITHSVITTPTSPFIYQYNADASPAPTVTIAGTTDSTAPGTDTVDINCYYGQNFGTLAHDTVTTGLALAGDGSFSYTGPVDVEGQTCQMRAVPSGYGDSLPLAPFAGVSSQLDHLEQNHVNGLSTPIQDFYYTATSTAAYDDYDSVGGCGLDASYPIRANDNIDSTGGSTYNTWDCAGALFNSDGAGARTEILIDGKNAYDSASAHDVYSDTISATLVKSGQAPGFPALTSSYVKDPATGNVSINEAEGLVSCADPSYPATQVKCGGTPGVNIGSWRSDGVSFARHISQTAGGQVVTMTDTYSSTDGQAHSLDLQYDNYARENDQTVWQLPGTSSYQAYSEGDQPSLSGNSMDVIYTKDGNLVDGNPYDGPGALIYSTQPNSALFTGYQDLLLGYQKTVPAGGATTITQTYVTAADQATLNSLVNGVVDQTSKPSVSITGPANGTVTQSSSVQVSGTAAAHDGLTLKVNGEAVGVNPDGSWSADLSLNRGANTITATASDGSGNTASAADSVTYEPATVPQPTFCIVPNVTRDSLGRAKRALTHANCSVGRVHRVKSRVFRRGQVEHASSSPGVVLVKGSKVSLTVSTGKPHRKHRRNRRNRKGHVAHGRARR